MNKYEHFNITKHCNQYMLLLGKKHKSHAM